MPSLVAVSIMAGAFYSVRIAACECGVPENPAERYAWKRTQNPSDESDIVVSPIVKQFNLSTFHYKTQYCGLKVKDVWDEDYRYEPTSAQAWCPYHGEYYTVWDWVGHKDYCNHNLCQWFGTGVRYRYGHSTVWSMAGIGSTCEYVVFGADDHAGVPCPPFPGQTVDDVPSVEQAMQMIAWEAIASLSVYPGGLHTDDRYESIGREATLSASLEHGYVWVQTNNSELPLHKSANAQWHLSGWPTGPVWESGKLRLEIGAEATGTLEGAVYDTDMEMSACTVTLTPAGPGFSITFGGGPGFAEGRMGAGFSIASFVLGSTNQPTLVMKSSDYWLLDPGEHASSVPFTFDETTTWECSAISDTTAECQIDGAARCDIDSPELSAWAKVGSTGNIIYRMGVPTFVPCADWETKYLNPLWNAP
jgi:hypothetical protein